MMKVEETSENVKPHSNRMSFGGVEKDGILLPIVVSPVGVR